MEYEALIIGMKWAHRASIKALSIYSDSQIVVNQVQGTYVVHSKSIWPTLREDTKAYVKSCNTCQVFGNTP